MKRKSKILLTIIILLLVFLVTGVICFKEGYKKYHIEQALLLELSDDVQVINYKREINFIAAKMQISKEQYNQFSKELKGSGFCTGKELKANGYPINESDCLFEPEFGSEYLNINWWDVEANQVIEYFYGWGGGAGMQSTTNIYIVKHDDNTLYVYFWSG